MGAPFAGEEAVELTIAVVEDAAARAEEVFPEHELVAAKGDEVGAGEILAVGIEAEGDVVLIVDGLLFVVYWRRRVSKSSGGAFLASGVAAVCQALRYG